jgi:putative flippase GtrA
MKLRELRFLSRAAIVSIAATGLEFLILPSVGRIMPTWASFASVQILANLVTFLLYKYWAFDAARVGSLRRQYAKQSVVFGGSWLLNTGIPSLLFYGVALGPRAAFAVSNVVVYLAWNYPLNRAWVFQNPSADAHG